MVQTEPERRTGEAELLARALGGSTPAADLSAVANRVARIPWWERRALDAAGLTREHGVPRERAERLAAMWELAERWTDDDRPAIGSPRDALLMLDGLRLARREQVVVLLLDARHRPIRLETVAVGTINASRLQPRDVFGPALRRRSCSHHRPQPPEWRPRAESRGPRRDRGAAQCRRVARRPGARSSDRRPARASFVSRDRELGRGRLALSRRRSRR
jgi:RadC-like JAB domain